MQIVIDIPNRIYKIIQNKTLNIMDDEILEKAVKNGTPLPKGHGRLIDANVIKDLKNKIEHYEKDYKFTQEEILNILERYEIKYTHTIIEADKEKEG